MRKYKTISIPIPVDPTSISQAIGILVIALGAVGYVIGDVRQPPAPAPEPLTIVITATPLPATPTMIPTFPPTPVPTQPVIVDEAPAIVWEAPAQQAEPVTWGVQVVIDTPVSEPVQVDPAPVVSNGADWILAVLNAASVMPPMDEAHCSQQVTGGLENKWESGMCYIRGPLDQTWTAINQPSELEVCSIVSHYVSGMSSTFDGSACVVTYNGITTSWTWNGTSWQQVG